MKSLSENVVQVSARASAHCCGAVICMKLYVRGVVCEHFACSCACVLLLEEIVLCNAIPYAVEIRLQCSRNSAMQLHVACLKSRNQTLITGIITPVAKISQNELDFSVYSFHALCS